MKNLSNKVLESKLFNIYDNSKSINWLYFDADVNNLNSKEQVFQVLHLGSHFFEFLTNRLA